MRIQFRAFYFCIVAVAVLVIFAADWGLLFTLSPADYGGLAVFIALATLSEHLAVESGTGQSVRSSVSFLPLLATVLLFPLAAVLVAVALMFLPLAFRKSRNWRGYLFNLAQTVVSLASASVVFTTLRGGTLPGVALGSTISEFLGLFGPFYGAAIAYFGLNILLVSTYIAIQGGYSLRPIVTEALGPTGGNLFYDLLASPVALLVAYVYWELRIAGTLVLALPLLLIRFSYLSVVQLERANSDLLRVLIKAIETRDPYTSGHSVRVSTLARMIGEALGLRSKAIEYVERAALLHDIGKIDALYAEIIGKDSNLTEQERAIIKTHASKGADLLRTLTLMEKEVVAGVKHHHERYDGTGYPDRLSGKEIPLAARVIMICDAVDAMLSDRPYRAALPLEDVRAELLRCSGSQFDPDIVTAILNGNTLERAELLVDRTGARTPVRAVG